MRSKDPRRKQGWHVPFLYTAVPHTFVDDWLPRLTGSEVKVYLYLARATVGWRKQWDSVSVSQIATGIPGRNNGTGLDTWTVKRALKSLKKWKLIDIKTEKGAPNLFAIRCDRWVENPPTPWVENPPDTQVENPPPQIDNRKPYLQ